MLMTHFSVSLKYGHGRIIVHALNISLT